MFAQEEVLIIRLQPGGLHVRRKKLLSTQIIHLIMLVVMHTSSCRVC